MPGKGLVPFVGGELVVTHVQLPLGRKEGRLEAAVPMAFPGCGQIIRLGHGHAGEAPDRQPHGRRRGLQ